MGIIEKMMGAFGYVKLSSLSPAQVADVAEQAKKEQEFLGNDLDRQIDELNEEGKAKEAEATKPKRVLSDEHKAKLSAAMKARRELKVKEQVKKTAAKEVKKPAKKVAAKKTSTKTTAKKTTKKAK